MAQFDVCPNLGLSRGAYPFFVIVQTRKLDYLRTRLVVPLGYPTRRELMIPGLIVKVDAIAYVLVPQDLFPAPLRALGPACGSLASDSTQVIQAIDDVITTAYN